MNELIRRQDAIDALDCINGVEEVLRSIPSAQSEVTEEEVKEYCRKRCLCIVDSALLKKYASAQDDVPDTNYTFGNDEFSLEAAYHDCKLVFDGITDDDSFQEADTGLILYYANEIIYALQKALEGNDANGRGD